MTVATMVRRTISSFGRNRVGTSVVSVPLFFQKLAYITPNVLAPNVPTSPEAALWLKDLQENGCVLIRDKFKDVADHLDSKYIVPIMSGRADEVANSTLLLSHPSESHKEVKEYFDYQISFKDEGLTRLLFNPDLVGVLYNYYGRQPYLRNHPILQRVKTTEAQTVYQSKFHIDGGLRQLSFMLLLNNITQKDTHMEYACSSNRWANFRVLRFAYEDAWVQSHWKLIDVVGQKGDLWIFDAGNGFHRASLKPNSERRLLHLNFTTGSHVQEFHESSFGPEELRDQPQHVRRLFDKVNLGQ